MNCLKIKIERTKKEPKLKKDKKSQNKKKIKVLKVGTHKKSVNALWILLVISLGFGVYKNFTAIDQHTIHEKMVVTEKLVDTSGIQSYVKSFAKDYFTWQNKKESIGERTKKINQYLVEDLQQLNVDLVRADIPTSSQVEDVQIVKVDKRDQHTFNVRFTVEQKITENKKTTPIQSTYETTVHQDGEGDKVIIQNPTMTANNTKSGYVPKQAESDGTVDSKTTDEVTKFLETFFKLYPKATKEELAYYVKDGELKPLQKDLIYSKVDNLTMDGTLKNGIATSFNVEYLNSLTKVTQIYQYHVILEKQKNWVIKEFK